MNLDDNSLIKLLAEVYMDDENHECFTFNPMLKMGLGMAQVKYPIKGGEKPSKEFIELFYQYCNDIRDNADWHVRFANKYFKSTK